MSIEGYFWTVLTIGFALMAVAFGAGRAAGMKLAKRGGGIVIGAAVIVIAGALIGGAKSQQAKTDWLVVYEAGWFAMGLNFALIGGYIAGKSRSAAGAPGKAVPSFCIVVALMSLYMMGIKLHRLVEVLQALGIGDRRAAISGPDTALGCSDSLKQIYKGFKHYTELNDALPPAAKWTEEEDLQGFVQASEWFHCPSVSNRKDDKYGFAYNDALAGRKLKGKKLSEIPDAAKTPLVYDSTDLAKNAHDALTSLPRPGRHGGRNHILYCDGHIEAVAPK